MMFKKNIPENRIWFFMQIIIISIWRKFAGIVKSYYFGDNLHEISNPIYGKKEKKKYFKTLSGDVFPSVLWVEKLQCNKAIAFISNSCFISLHNSIFPKYSDTFKPYITKTRPFKYIENFICKNWKFSDKKLWYFSYFCSKHRLWVLVRTASPRRF